MRDLTDFQPSRRFYTDVKELRFYRLDEPPHYGSYYAFECDAQGVVDLEALTPTQRESWQRSNDRANYHPAEIFDYQTTSRVSAHGKCQCGRTVYLDDPLWNSCDCGRWYNMSGQSVISPERYQAEVYQETGESVFDIYNGRDEDY